MSSPNVRITFSPNKVAVLPQAWTVTMAKRSGLFFFSSRLLLHATLGHSQIKGLIIKGKAYKCGNKEDRLGCQFKNLYYSHH